MKATGESKENTGQGDYGFREIFTIADWSGAYGSFEGALTKCRLLGGIAMFGQ